MKKALYFDCASGISGDMSVAALLDLGADKKMLLDTLDSLNLSGYKIEISELEKSGICACDFNVLLDKKHENHDHDMEYLHGKDCGHNHIEHEHKDAHQHNTHTHHHEHRSLPDILSILENSSMTAGAKAMASKIFEILAEGEARAHRVPKEQVHFHEVGAVDSIVDIAAFAICMDFLGYKEVFLPVLREGQGTIRPKEQVHFHEVGAVDSIVDIAAFAICMDFLGYKEVFLPVLREGQGTIRCQHGILPIPVPATSNIVCAHKLPLSIIKRRAGYNPMSAWYSSYSRSCYFQYCMCT